MRLIKSLGSKYLIWNRTKRFMYLPEGDVRNGLGFVFRHEDLDYLKKNGACLYEPGPEFHISLTIGVYELKEWLRSDAVPFLLCRNLPDDLRRKFGIIRKVGPKIFIVR